MPARRHKSKSKSPNPSAHTNSNTLSKQGVQKSDGSMAVSSSLNTLHVNPSPITSRNQNRMPFENGEEDLELNLLAEHERHEARLGLEGYESEPIHDATKRPISMKDKKAMVLLCVLCEYHSNHTAEPQLKNETDLIQGVPVSFSSNFKSRIITYFAQTFS
jgi:MFS transporter, PAT family, solute carrier family 33 (acetyl-CoA transportor), member 1